MRVEQYASVLMIRGMRMAYVTVKRTFLLLLQMIAFYLLRIILGAACALCEFYFYGLALHVCAKRITLQYMC